MDVQLKSFITAWVKASTKDEAHTEVYKSIYGDMHATGERLYFEGVHIASLFRAPISGDPFSLKYIVAVARTCVVRDAPFISATALAPISTILRIVYELLYTSCLVLYVTNLDSLNATIYSRCELLVKDIAKLILRLKKEYIQHNMRALLTALDEYEKTSALIAQPPLFRLVDDLLPNIWPIKTLIKIAPDAATSFSPPQEIIEHIKANYSDVADTVVYAPNLVFA